MTTKAHFKRIIFFQLKILNFRNCHLSLEIRLVIYDYTVYEISLKRDVCVHFSIGYGSSNSSNYNQLMEKSFITRHIS